MRLIVDGMNVIGARPDGWWRDRASARRRLVSEVASRFEPSPDAVTIVFDGHPEPGELQGAREAGVTILFAPGGPDAADHAIVALLGSIEKPRDVTVVTSDAALADAARQVGATVLGARAFRRQLEDT